MSELTNNTEKAERMIGCSFAETFESNEAVVANGGTITGTPVIDNGATFTNGDDDYLDYSSFPTPQTISITCKVTMNSKDGGSGAKLGITGVWNSSSSVFAYLLAYNETSSRLDFLIYDGATRTATSDADLTIGQEYAIMATYDGTTAKLYIDGVLQSITDTGTAIVYPTANAVLQVGRYFNNNSSWDGVIKELKIFETTLTAQDATNFYNNSTYNYMNDTVVNLQMRSQDHDPSGTDGTELLVDGDMEAAGVGDWTANDSVLTKETGTRTGGSGIQVLRVTRSASTYWATQVCMTVGKQYRLRGWARSDGNDAPVVFLHSGTAIWTGTNSTDWQKFDITGAAEFVQVFIGSLGNTTSAYVEFDDVSVELIEEKTLDVSGNGNHGILGDGNTATTFPTKLSKRGYNFDGTTDYVDLGSDLIGTGACSVSFLTKAEGSGGGGGGRLVDNSQLLVWIDTSNNRVKFSSNGASTQANGTTGDWVTGDMIPITITRTAAGVANIYINGRLSGTADQASGTPASGSNVIVGNNNAITRDYDGDIDAFMLHDSVLTHLQVNDLHTQMMREINNI